MPCFRHRQPANVIDIARSYRRKDNESFDDNKHQTTHLNENSNHCKAVWLANRLSKRRVFFILMYKVKLKFNNKVSV